MANKDLTRDEAREQWHAKTLAEKEFELVAKFDISDKSLMVNDGDKPVVIMEKDFKVILKNENNNPTKTQRGVRPTDFNKKLFLIKHESGKEVVCMKAVEGMLKNPDTVDNFKRASVLLYLRYVICAPANGKLRKNILKYVEHADNLKNQRWEN
ncbi:hypothetical protein Tco_0255446 [Tanacetum coccineum]